MTLIHQQIPFSPFSECWLRARALGPGRPCPHPGSAPHCGVAVCGLLQLCPRGSRGQGGPEAHLLPPVLEEEPWPEARAEHPVSVSWFPGAPQPRGSVSCPGSWSCPGWKGSRRGLGPLPWLADVVHFTGHSPKRLLPGPPVDGWGPSGARRAPGFLDLT